MVDEKFKSIYNFDVYYSKSMHTLQGCDMVNLEINLEHEVINLTLDLITKGISL